VHERVRFDIKADDADSIAATLNRDVAIPFIQLNYGPQKKYPRIWFKVSEPENVLLRMQATQIFVNQGGRVQESEARDLLGWSEPDKDAYLMQPEAKVTADAQPPPPEPKPVDPKDPANPAPPGDDKKAAEKSLNRQVRQLVELLSSKPRADDVIDELVDEDLSEWEPLLDENVGEMLRLVQGAETFEEAGDLLRKLAEDKGVTLDFGTFQDAIARSTFKTRGIGSATDETT
jgi:phage gp29-like protein